MKKIIIITTFILLFFNNGMVNAQDNIISTITKEIVDGKIRVCLNITNNNPKEIVISTYASWGENDAVGFLKGPVSYVQFFGTGGSLFQTRVSEKVVLSKNIDMKTPTQLRPLLKIKAGETHKICYYLFDETHRPYKPFKSSDREFAKRVYGKVLLKYAYPTEAKIFEKEINTNTLSL